MITNEEQQYVDERRDRINALAAKARELKVVVGSDEQAPELDSDGSLTLNAFCPTGEGGGVDPSCSPFKLGQATDFATHGTATADRIEAEEAGKASPDKKRLKIAHEEAMNRHKSAAKLYRKAGDKQKAAEHKSHAEVHAAKLAELGGPSATYERKNIRHY